MVEKNGDCIGLKPEAKFKKDLSIFPESLTISDKSLDASGKVDASKAHIAKTK